MTCSVPCRRCRDAAGSTPSSAPPTGCSNAVSISTRPDATRRRASDGRSLWIEPTAPRFTSEAVLAEEEHIVTWAIDAQTEPPAPSTTVNGDGLDVLQAEAAASVAGDDRLVLVVGPAGAGKTRMLAAAVADLHEQRSRRCSGWRRRRKRRGCCERDTAMRSDTVAKLLHEWQRPDRPPLPEFQLPRRHDGRRRRGRHALDPCAAPARHVGRGASVAARPRRRPPPAASRRPWRPVRRAVRQRPASTSSNSCTASPTAGKPPRPCCCDPAIHAPSTPTKPTTGSSPAASTPTSNGWPRPGSNTTSEAKRSPSSPRRTNTSTPSTVPCRRPDSPQDTSTAVTPRRSLAVSTFTSVTSSPPVATTAR